MSEQKGWDELYSLKTPWQKLSWRQQMDVVQNWAHFIVLTVMVFARRKLGYRMLNPIYLIVTGFVLILLQNVQLPYIQGGQPTFWPYPLTIYVIAMIAWGLVQRRMRWRELMSGAHWHTYSRGVSYFSFLPLPEDIIRRFVDPAAVMIVGVVCWMFVSTALGLWLMIGAIAFLAAEIRFYDLVLGGVLDMLDGMEENRVQSEIMMGGPQSAPAKRTVEQTAGIPTGVGDDLIRAVQKRRAEAAESPIVSASERAA